MDNRNQTRRSHLLSGSALVLGFLFVCSGQAANYYDIAIDPFAKYKKAQPLIPDDGPGDDPSPAYYKDVLAQSNVSFDITPETTGLIGEQIDLSSGAVSFTQTDLTIPGNSKLLPITIRRSFSDANFKQKATAEFADWSLDLPSIHTTVLMPGTANAGSWGKGLECSGTQRPGAVMYKGQMIDAPQYWNGTVLLVDSAQKHLLYRGTPDVTYTTKDHWKATCFKKADGSGEGYKVTAPNGVVYTLDVPHAVRNYAQDSSQRALPIYHLYLRVSQITDPHGNWLKYKYTAYTNANQKTSQRLTEITSNDGRSVQFTYDSDKARSHLIQSISAAGQQWKYQYSADYLPSLLTTTLPYDPEKPEEQTSWQYDLKELALWHNPEFYLHFTEMQRTCTKKPMSIKGSIKHPHGAKAEFQIAPVFHGRTQVYLGMDRGAIDKDSRCYMTLGLQTKTLQGPGLTEMRWDYSYSENYGSYKEEDTAVAVGVEVDSYDSKDLKTTSVSAPDGSKTMHIFYRGWDYREGQQIGTLFLDTDGKTELKRHWSTFSVGEVQVGQPLIDSEFSANAASLSMPAWLQNASIELPGKEAHSYHKTFSQYNEFDVSEKVVETNSIGTPARTTELTHQHDTQNWILNLLQDRKITLGTSSYSEYAATYYEASATERSALKSESRNGAPFRSFTYHADGTVNTVTYDVASRWIAFSNYKRGKPQTIQLPNRYDDGNFKLDLQQVNDSGTIAWASDLNGNKTQYEYDRQNRLTLIDPVDKHWDNTVITYSPDTSGKAALFQEVQQGNYRKTLSLDALMRPVLSKEWDDTNEESTVRYINQRFNAYGQPGFSSVASNQSTESFGVQTTYDGLQRILTQSNTGQGDLSYQYNPDNSVTVENERGYQTTSHYLAYGELATDLITKIVQPEGVTTEIEYNVAGLPTEISQGAITEIRRYDEYMRFCLLKRPDTGMKVMERNTLGDLTRYVEGASGKGTHCQDYTAKNADWVGIAYDSLGDVNTVTYGDNTTSTRTHNLDRQGNLLKLSAGNTVWEYSYNTKHQIENETLTTGSKTFAIINSYDGLGHMKQLQYGGDILDYAPNALGAPTQATGSQIYASKVQYHANGSLSAFTYGNGLEFSQSLNAEFMPSERTVQKGTENRSAQSYQYDSTNNLTSISDLVQSTQSVTLTYDGLDRLQTATGPWGAGSFSYDETGNLLSKQLGSQLLEYSYDSTSNRLNKVSAGYDFSYDARGNVTHNGKHAFSFNHANQLVSAANQTYSYDGHGRRVAKTSPAATAYSVYNRAGKLLLTEGPHGQVRYIYLGNKLIAKVGSSQALEDKPGYTGHVEDKDIGLTYMQQRYYDPVIGRFYSNDPLGFRDTQSFNRYAYANNNPYKYVDPTGMASETENNKIGFCGVSGCDYSYSSGSTSNSKKEDSNSGGGTAAATTAVIGRATSQAGVAIPRWVKTPWGLVLMAVLPTQMGDGTFSQQELENIQPSRCLPMCTLADSSQIPVGSISYRLDMVPPSTPHYPFTGDHVHLYEAMQNPNNCQCFWKEFNIVSPPPPLNAIPIQPFIR